MQPGGSEPSLMPNQAFHLFQPKIKNGVTNYVSDPTFRVRCTPTWICKKSYISFKFWRIVLTYVLWAHLWPTQRHTDYNARGGGVLRCFRLNIRQKEDHAQWFRGLHGIFFVPRKQALTAWFTSLRGWIAQTYRRMQASKPLDRACGPVQSFE